MTNNKLTDQRIDEIIADGFLAHGEAKKLAAELQEYHKASNRPALSVQFKDGWPVPETAALVVGAELLTDGFHDFYAAPPLQAVTVPDEMNPTTIRAVAAEWGHELDDDEANAAADAWNACREAMRTTEPNMSQLSDKN